MKIWVYFIGKPRDASANAIAAEFLKREEQTLAAGAGMIFPLPEIKVVKK